MDTTALNEVAYRIAGNSWEIERDDLASLPNPNGEGVFVYVKYQGGRNRLWLVLDGTPYPLNAPSKKLTPKLPWPREAPEGTWERTGLSPYQATEAIEIVFGQ